MKNAHKKSDIILFLNIGNYSNVFGSIKKRREKLNRKQRGDSREGKTKVEEKGSKLKKLDKWLNWIIGHRGIREVRKQPFSYIIDK